MPNPQNGKLKAFVAEEVSKVQGIAVPVCASVLERALVRKTSCKNLHPNPQDEFCDPEIGPNEEIIRRYEEGFRFIREYAASSSQSREKGAIDLLDVQKIHPSGYMILNGHHRWIAAMNMGVSKLPIRIVNLTTAKDIRRMIEHAHHSKRLTMDLDEVIFAPKGCAQLEKPVFFPLNHVYRERIMLGIPALISYFQDRRYDIWVYTSGNYSPDYIRKLLKLHRIHVTGIVTGTGRKGKADQQEVAELQRQMMAKYTETIHLDHQTILRIDHQTKEHEELSVPGVGTWAAEVIEIMRKVK